MSESATAPRPSSTRGDILDRLHELTEGLCTAHRELAFMLRTELEGRVRAWSQGRPEDLGQKDSISARDRLADIGTLDIASDIIELKGEIAAMREERDWCRTLLDIRDFGTSGNRG